ncbi:MAG: hypothetical protein ACYCVN_04250 [Acidimicrobiales bacterium]
MSIPNAADQVVSFNGQTFSAPVTLPGANNLEAVGCAPNGYCAAIDAEGNAFSYDGQWQGTIGAWGSASSISCVSATFCMAASGGIARWDGVRWTKPDPFGATSSFTGVSCPSASFCTAVDETGYALQWNGQTFSAPVPIEPASNPSTGALGPAPSGVSCPTASFCAAVDDHGAALQWSGGHWTRTVIDAGHHLTSVSCPTPTFCMAVDQSGDALLGRTASS